jgi:hypothetical protein
MARRDSKRIALERILEKQGCKHILTKLFEA